MKAVYLTICIFLCISTFAQSSLDSTAESCLTSLRPSGEDSSFQLVSIHFSEQRGGCIPMLPVNTLSMDVLLLNNGTTWAYVRQGDSVIRYKLPINAGPSLCIWYVDLLQDTSYCGGFAGGIPVIVQIEAEDLSEKWRYCKGGMRNHRENLLNLISDLAATRERYR
ncbi:MAG: hypothetical protein HWE14_10585 [Flavobacteriia bacterium]|nr:hypothetical protein [Flavobacteriia bacterium]